MGVPYRTLRTERLVLRRPVSEDAARVFRSYGTDPEVTRFLAWRPHRSLADARNAMAARLERLAAGTELSWVLEPAAADPADPGGTGLAGLVSAWLERGEAELGFVLARRHWGRGLMTEAVRAVVAMLFEAPGPSRVWATCDAENLASARVLEKAGLLPRGRFARDIVRPNLAPEPRPSLLFERLRPPAEADP